MSNASGQHQKVERAFLAALNFVSGAPTQVLTETRLRSLCEEDDFVRREVASLLGHAAKAEGYSRSGRGFLDPDELHRQRGTVAFSMADSREIIIGQAVSHFVITSEIGAGGMGIVYEARDTNLRRSVALKFLRPSYARNADTRSRFLREARIASALNHPHICTIYSLDEFNEQPFVAMEFVEGKTLRALANERISLERAIRLMEQTAQALDAAHKMGVVHRDIKPENLMVREDDWIKVLDFGVARLFPDVLQPGGCADTGTASGVLIGTTRYMSPEQARCEESNAASDIFSLGIVFYELATGQHPFESSRGIAVLEAISSQSAVSPRIINPEIPPELETLLLQMLEKSPHSRPSAEEVISRLEQLSTSALQQAATPARSKPPCVGRSGEREFLQSAFAEAVGGRGGLICVTGEPGIGKTTLVEEFLSDLTRQQPCLIARGRCSERLAGAEVYFPFLEAMDDMLRGPDGATVARMMKAAAPAWHALLRPGNAQDEDGVSREAIVAARLQERLKLELMTFLQELGRTKTMVLFLDDLHWADLSTVDLLSYIGGKCQSLRLLVILTYRPVDLVLDEHPFHAVKLELEGRGQCREMQLEFLGREDVDAYLAILFPGHCLPEFFTEQIRSRSGGNPLFLVDLTRYLRALKVIVQQSGKWTLAAQAPDWQKDLPPSVRSLIQKKLGQLSDEDRRLLVAASVQGNEFDVAVVASALQLDVAEVEERIEVLSRVYALVRMIREHKLPDGTATIRFAFMHVLYQNALYNSLQPTRRGTLSAAVAAALGSFYGDPASCPKEGMPAD